MYEIDHIFLFLSLLFQSNLEWGGGGWGVGGCVSVTCSEPYIYICMYMSEGYLFLAF